MPNARLLWVCLRSVYFTKIEKLFSKNTIDKSKS